MEGKRIKEYVRQSKKEAKDSLKNRRKQWEELWMLYQNKQDYSNKDDWQSKTFIPKIFMSIEQASAMVKKALVHIDKLFELRPKETDVTFYKEKQFENKIDEKFKQKMEESNFRQVYGDTVKSSFLLGLGAIKTLWEDDGLKFENIDIMDLYVDPDWRPYIDDKPRYIIQHKEEDLVFLKKKAKSINEGADEEIYDMEKIEELSSKKKEKTRRERMRKGLSPYKHPTREKVQIEEFWGDVIDNEGNVLENQLIMIANGKHIIRHQDNPFDHNEYPYNLVIPIPYPHRGVAGVSLVESIIKMQYTYNNIINMVVDNLNYSVNKTFVANWQSFRNPDKITSLYPGKVTWSTGDASSALQELDVTNVGNDVYNALNFLSKEMQKGSAVTDLIMGVPSKKRKTATEVELSQSQAKGLFDVIARDLEKNNLKPLLEKVYKVLVQFEVLPDVDRRIEVGGLSLILDKRREMSKYTQILQLLGQNEQLLKEVDVNEILKKIFLTLDMEDVIKDKSQTSPQTPPQGEGAQTGGGNNSPPGQSSNRRDRGKKILERVKNEGEKKGQQLAQDIVNKAQRKRR